MKKAGDAKDANEKAELQECIAMGVHQILLKRGSKMDSISNYYKDQDTFVDSAGIADYIYTIEDYEYEENLASGKIYKNNGTGKAYNFQIDTETGEITIGDNEEMIEPIVETDSGYFTYSSYNEKDTITGLTQKGIDAYNSGENDFINLVIPKVSSNGYEVIGIKNGVFNNKTKINKLVLHDGITNIDWSAFSDCTEIKDLTLPITINLSGSGIFTECTKIEKVTLTKGSTGIGIDYGTYQGNFVFHQRLPWYISRTNSMEIIIEEGVIQIGTFTFYNCQGITTVRLPSSIQTIGDYAFVGITNPTYSYSGKNWENVNKGNNTIEI